MALLIDRFKRPRTLAVIGVVVVLIVLRYVGALRPIEAVTTAVISPFQRVAKSLTVAVQRIGAPFSSVISLQERNKALEQEKNELLVQLTSIQQELALQKVLETQFAHLTERHFTFVPGKIIGAGTDQTFDSIVVSIGDTDGVKVGQAVVVDQGVLIGTVRSVEAQHAEILLVSDNRSIIDAATNNETAAPGAVTGQFSANLIMDLIPQGRPLVTNDIVVTRANNSGIPAGLIIGKIVEIENNPGQLFQSALIAPAATIDTAVVVSIITGTQ